MPQWKALLVISILGTIILTTVIGKRTLSTFFKKSSVLKSQYCNFNGPSVLYQIPFSVLPGNVLVIISVFTYTPLKITPNFFIVSLAAADLTVSVCVLPFNVAYMVLGR